MDLLEARGLHKVYDTRGVYTRALDGVDIDIAEGEFTALAGPSGSGKTTLLNVLGALDTPDEGDVVLDGQRYRDLDSGAIAELRLRKLGFVFQSYNLIPVFSALENVEFVMELQGIDAKQRRARAQEVLEQVGLGDLGKKRPLEMSGGQQQRVAVARAIASHPRLVLADEPTANLDSTTAHALIELMLHLNDDHGVTFLFSTHDPLVMDSARRLVRMQDGRLASDERRG